MKARHTITYIQLDKLCLAAAFCFLLLSSTSFAEDALDASIDQHTESMEEKIHKTENTLDTSTDKRIEELEEKVQKLEASAQFAHRNQSAALGESVFNPAMDVILSGKYGYFSQDKANIPGFQTGNEGMRIGKGFSLEETSITLKANVDHKLYSALTVSIINEDGVDKVDLEEAFFKTLGLPFGFTITAGRKLVTFGYMNEKHKHTDDFVDRPLPYRVYLNTGFSDDGVQTSIVLPTVFYSEIGAGVFRGRDFPANPKGNSPGLITTYARVGGDIGISNAWRLGVYYMHAKSDGEGRDADGVVFNGNNDLYCADFRYTYSPAGNNRVTEFALQAEYIFRNEKGDFDNGMASADINAKSSGFYAQAVYKFRKNYRLGYRYAFLDAPRTPMGFENTSLNAGGRNPMTHSMMAEYNTSEYGRFRMQYNNDRTFSKTHHQVIFQYTLTLGAHGAHGF